MNKNTIIKIFSLVMIFAVIISTVGCSLGDEGTKDGEAGVLDVESLQPENGTIIYEGTKVNEEGKTEKISHVVDVEHIGEPMVDPDKFFENDADKDEFIKEDGKEDYGMTDEEIKDVVDNAENYKSFYIYELVENKTDKTMVCKSVSAKKGDGIYVRTKLDAEYGIGSGNCTSIAIHATADMNKYKTDEELEAALDKLDIKIEYALTDNPYGEIEDWDSVTTKVIEL